MINDPSEFPFVIENTRVTFDLLEQTGGNWRHSSHTIYLRHNGISNILFAGGNVEGCDLERIRDIDTGHSEVLMPGYEFYSL